MNIATLAADFATELRGLTPAVNATADPRAATGQACVLVPPPVVDYREKLATWTLYCLAGTSVNDLATLRKLAGQEETLRTALRFTVEETRPTTVTLAGPDSQPFPALACRVTSSV